MLSALSPVGWIKWDYVHNRSLHKSLNLSKSKSFLSLTNPVPTACRLIWSILQFILPNLPLPHLFKPFSHHSLLSRNRSAFGQLSKAGEQESHTSVCFSVGKIIKFLLTFSLGLIFEGFSYFNFYKDSPVYFLLVCYIPPSIVRLSLKGLPIHLPLEQLPRFLEATLDGISHSCMHVTPVMVHLPTERVCPTFFFHVSTWREKLQRLLLGELS